MLNDEAGGNRIRVKIDYEDAEAVSHNIGEGMFCALNVEAPKDELFVGSFYRDQAVATEGIFKFGTNIAQDQAQVSPDRKRVLANATIDEFVTFTGNYSPLFGATGYFTDKRGTYSNLFKIPFPEGIKRIRVRSFNWTVYPPTSYSGIPVRWQAEQHFRMGVSGLGQSSQAMVQVTDPGGDKAFNSAVAGRWVYARTSLGASLGEVVYEVQMNAATGAGLYGARTVASPVLDDVTLTYYLPTAQILLTETED